jgi:hypothetical protein
VLDFGKKLLPETRNTIFVEDCCCPEFGVRDTVKLRCLRPALSAKDLTGGAMAVPL